MGEQIIRQPDGNLAVFSSITDSWVTWDATPEEVIEWYAEQAAQNARERVGRVVDEVVAGRPETVYYQFAMSFDEAQEKHSNSGEPPILFGFLDEEPTR